MADMLTDDEKSEMRQERAEMLRELEMLRAAENEGNSSSSAGVTDSQNVTRRENPAAQNATPMSPNSSLIGVAYEVGKLVTRFDYMTGLVIANTKGGGVYLLLKDGTALKNPPAPHDINLGQYIVQNPSTTKNLRDLKISKQDIFPPHAKGYRVDFYGEDNTPGIGGPTFRAFLLNKQGFFKESTTTLISGPDMGDGLFGRANSSASMSGSYYIDGNTIELQFNNGKRERRVFGTNGQNKAIIGHRLFRVPSRK